MTSRAAAVLAGQETVLQRAPRHQRHPLVERERGDLTLDGPGQQRVLDLQRDQRCPAAQQAMVCAWAVTQAGVLENPM